MSAETSTIDLDKANKEKKDDEDKKDKDADAAEQTTELSETEAKDLCSWLSKTLGAKRVREVSTMLMLLELD